MRQNRKIVLRQFLFASLVGTSLAMGAQPAAAPAPGASLTTAQKETFLLKAKVRKTQEVSKGITTTIRATMSDGTITHDATIQTIDDTKHSFQTPYGTEAVYRDTWKYNVAAYKLAGLLGLNMIPVTVERDYEGNRASYTWAVDNLMFDEERRENQKQQPPNMVSWNEQIHVVNVFDQLIFNIDRNQGTLLIDKDWQVWMVGHTRSFRSNPTLMDSKMLGQCDAALLEKLKQLDAPTLKKAIGSYVESDAIPALLVRRDKIVEYFESKGPSALFHMAARAE